MNPKTNQDTGLNLPSPGVMTATMPLPGQVPDASSQGMSAAAPIYAAPTIAPEAPRVVQSMNQQEPPIPAQAPPLSMSAMSAAAQSPTVPQPLPVQSVVNTVESVDNAMLTSAIASLPAEAADTDVIEKEWVVKAKQVVAETTGDPYKQVRELNKLRADYMKKRYNKDLKLPDA